MKSNPISKCWRRLRGLGGRMTRALQRSLAVPAGEEPRDRLGFLLPLEERHLPALSVLGTEFLNHTPGSVAAPAPGAHHELVVIDRQVAGWQDLAADVRVQALNGRALEVVYVNAGEDGIAAVSKALSADPHIDAIHFISHGNADGIQLGSTWLDEADLGNYASQISGWQAALAPGADLLFYECDLAAAAPGRDLLSSLHALTGADIAANTGATGSASLGGSWDLSYRIGPVHTGLAVSAAEQQQWLGLLGISTNSTTFAATPSGGASSLTFAHTVASGNNSILVVTVSVRQGGANEHVTSITYGSQSLTQAGVAENSGHADAEIWYLLAPTPGTANVVVNESSNHPFVAGATDYFGVNQTTPLGTFVSATGPNGPATVTVSSAPGQLVIDAVGAQGDASTLTPSAAQTQLWYAQTGNSGGDADGGGSEQSGAASVPMSWTEDNSKNWAIAAVPLVAAPDTAPVAANDSYTVNENSTLIVSPPSANLANWYKLDDGGTSQTATDSGSLGNNGTLGSTAGVDANDPTWTSGFLGPSALSFNGTSDYVTTTSTVAKTASSFTLSAWFQTNTTTGQQHILWEGFSGGDGNGTPGGTALNSEMNLSVGAYNQNNRIVFFLGYDVPADGADPIYIVSNSDFTDTTRFHNAVVTVTDLGGGVFQGSLYVDGVLEGTDTGVQNDRSAWGALQIGAPSAATRFFNGTIDDVRVYNTALTAAQAQGIAQAGLLQNDSDVDGGPIYVNTSSVTAPAHGTVSVNADGSFKYTPNAEFTGTDTFTYKANDGTLDSNVATVTITVNPINDPPVRTGGSVNNLSVFENAGATSLGLGSLTYSAGDADDGGQTLTYTVTAVPAGALGNIVLADGVTVVSAGSNYSLAQLQGMQFKPASEAIGGPVTFSWKVQDNGGTANGGSDTLTESLTISVSPVNDPPVRTTGTVSNLTVLENAGPSSLGLGSLTYAPGDADDNGQTLTYTVTAVPPAALGNVVLSDGTTVVTAGTTYSLAQLQGMQFKATAEASGGPATFTWTVKDNGGTANGGNDTLTESLTITVTAINDPPLRTGGSVNNLTVFENAAATSLGLGTLTYSAGDADDSAQTLTYTVTAVPAAALGNIVLADGTTVVNAGSTYSLLQLQGMQFRAAAEATGGPATFSWQVQDNGGTANGGINTLSESLTISVTPVNDAPVRTTGSVNNLTVLENAAATSLGLGSLTYAPGDADDAGQTLSYTITSVPAAAFGTILLADGTTVVTAGTSYTLAQLQGMQFKPASEATGGPATFAWSVQDNGGTANGGSDTLGEALTINVTPINDSPIRTGGTVNNLTVLENSGTTSLGLGALTYSAGDADDAAQTLTYTVTSVPAAALGTIVLADGTTVVNAGSSYTLLQLQGMQFKAAPEGSGGPASFSWSVQDSGGTANGGVNTLNESLTISVTAINDPPVRSGGSVNNLTVLENAAATSLGLGSLTYTAGDADDAGQTLTYTVTSVPAAAFGTILLADGTTVVTAGTSYTLAQLQGMQFKPASEATGGPATFAWSVQDNGGTANGGSDTLSEALTISITPINDSPVRTGGTVNNLTVLENSGTTSLSLGTLTYSAGDADDVGQTLTYTVTAVPAATLGNIVLADGTTLVTAGTSYTLAQLQGMQFQAAAEATGGPATFSWNVRDNGGTANGGIDTLSESLTISVTPINDPPVRTAGSVNNLTVLENAGTTSLGLAGLTYAAGDADDAGQTLSYTVTSVPAVALGSIVLADGTTVVTAGTSYTLAQLQGMQFKPASEATGGPATFAWNVRDNGGTANGGVDTLSESLTISITPVNDPPVRTAGSVNNLTVLENSASASLGLGTLTYSAGDADDAGQTLTYTVTAVPAAAFGTITLANGTTVVTTGTSYTLAQLRGMRFSAAAEATGGPATFSWRVQDNGGTANAGSDTLNESLTITVTPINDVPLRTAGSVNNLTVLENSGATTLGLGSLAYSPGDADDASQALTYTITTVPAALGTILLADGTTIVSAGNSYTLAQLQGMQFRPSSEATGGPATFSWTVQDDGGTANGGVDTLTESLTIAVTPVNDPPVRTAGAVNNLTVPENAGPTSLGLSGLGYVPGDADDAGQTLTYTVTAVPAASLGTILLADGTTVVSAGSSYTLAQLQGMQFQPTTEAIGGPATFSWNVQDNGGTANGGSNTLGEALTITVIAVNDPPVRTAGSVNNLTVKEDSGPTSLGLGTLTYSPGDADDAAQTLTYTVTVVPPATLGQIVLSDDKTVVTAGTSYTLAQLRGMKFVATDDATGGPVTFSWQVQDNGGTANGGVNTLTESLTITVTPILDPPTRTAGSVNNLTVFENSATTSLGLGGLNYDPGDSDDVGLVNSYQVTAVPPAALGSIVLADGVTVVSAGSFYSLAQLQGMQFRATPEAVGGPASFTWVVNNNSPDGDPETLTESLTITVNPVNDPPVRTAGSVNNLTVLENAGATSLGLGSLTYGPGDADDAGQTLTYTVTAVPAAAFGNVVLADGVTVVSAGTSYTLAQLRGMQFRPTSESTGGPATFSWQIQDNAGTANGGNDTLNESLTISVTPINDSPLRTAGTVSNLTVLENSGLSSLGLGTLAYSPGDADDSAQTLTYTVTAVPGAAFGSILLADGVTVVSAGSSYTLAQLQGMQFRPSAEATGGPVTFAWKVQDSGGIANGGIDTLSESLTISVTPINDPPIRTAGTVSNLTVLENSGATSLGLGGLAYAPGDFDDASQSLTYTITAVPPAAFGSIVLADGTTVVSAGSSYTLAQLQGMQFRPTLEATGGPATFAWQVQDNGGTANGGIDKLSEALTISVTPVNDAPVRTAGTVSNLSVLENSGPTALGLAGLAYAPGDFDDASQTLTYTVTAVPAVGFGRIVLADGTTVVSAGTSYTLAQLQGMQFEPATEATGGPVTFAWQVQDSGGIANGGIDTLSESLTISVTPINDPPVRTAGTVNDLTVLENSGLTSLGLGGLTYSAGDFDDASQTLTYTVTAVPAAGVGRIVLADGVTVVNAGNSYTLAQLQGMQFQPAVEATGGPATFAWQVQDNGGTANGGMDTLGESLAINITPVNDAPVRTAGTVSNLTVLENSGPTSLGLAGLAYAPGDFDDARQTLTYTVTAVPAAGFGRIVLADGTTVVSAGTSYTLAQLQGMQFEPATEATGGPVTFAWQVQDSGGTANGGIDTLSESLTIRVTPINDIPIRTAGSVNNLTVLENSGATSLGLAGLTYAGGDFDDASQTLTYTVTTVPGAAFGRILLADGVTVVTAGSSYTLAQLQGMQFQPAVEATGGPATFAWQVQDNGGTANGGIDTLSESLTISVMPVNDAPVRTAGIVNNLTVLENSGLTSLGLAGLTYAPGDFDDASQTLTYTVTAVPAAAFGRIVLADGTTVVSAGSSYTLAQLQGMQFEPATEATGGPVTFAWQVQDSGGSANGGVDTLSESLTISVTPINDPPVRTAGTVNDLTVLENSGLTSLGLGGLTYSAGDFDDASQTLTYTVTAVPAGAFGRIVLADGVTVVNAGSSYTLAQLQGMQFQPAVEATGGPATFAWQVQDNGGTANGGIDTLREALTISVTPVNDAPVRTAGTVSNVTVLENSGPTALGLAGLAYAPGDFDDASQTLTYIVTTVPAAGFGNIVLADGTTVVTAGSSYTLAQLQGMQFQPATEATGGPVTFAWQVQDNGGTANGGVDTLSEALTISVTPINDPPVRTAGTVNNLTVLENSGLTSLGLGSLAYAPGDLDDASQALTYTVTAVPAAAFGRIVLADGTTVVNAGSTYTLAQLQGMQFQPAFEATGGPATFAWQVQDNGGTANGGIDTLSESLTISVTPINDPPVRTAGAVNNLTVLENSGPTSLGLGGLAYSPGDFDDANQKLTYTVTTVPAAAFGSILLADGVTVVTAGSSYTLAQLQGMQFVPATEATGGPVTFAWQVQDNGGTANAGVNTLSESLTISVTPINDPPVRTGGTVTNLTVLENSGVTSLGLAGLGYAPGDFDDASQALTYTVTAVPAAGFGRILLADGVTVVSAGSSYTLAQLQGMQFQAISEASGGPATFAWQVQDNGGTANGGIDTLTQSLTISITPVNDPPVRTAGAVNNLTVLENNGATSLGLGGLAYSPGDFDDASRVLTFTVTAVPGAAFGNIVLADGVTVVTAGSSYTLAQLQGMQFQPATEATGGPATFAWQVQDSGGTANGGIDTLSESLTITITPVNDAPVRTGGSVTNLTVLENSGATSLGLAGLTYAPGDFDDAGQSLTYTVTSVPAAALGRILLADGTTVVTAGSSYTLAQLQGMQFVPTTESTGGPVTFAWQVQDNGGTANGGVDTLSESLTISVTPVNDPPVRTGGAVADLTVLEDSGTTSLGLGGLTYSVGDFDDAGQSLAYIVTAVPAPAQGEIVLADGVTVVTAGGSYTLAELQGMQFRTVQDANGGPFVFAWQVEDDGGTANGGIDTLAEALTISVTAVNDAPILTVPPAQSGQKDVPLVFSVASGNVIMVSDVDAGGGSELVTLTATNGTLTLHSVAGLTFAAGTGGGDATMTFTGTLDNLNAALDGLRFDPTPGYGGAAGLAVYVNDQGNTGLGGPLTDAKSVAIFVGTPGISATPLGSLVTTEAGGQAQFAVVLDTKPTANVTVTVTSSDPSAGVPSVQSLTFTPDNWDQAQIVTVTGQHDFIDTPDKAYSIILGSAVSADADYNGHASPTLVLVNRNIDVAGVTVTPVPGSQNGPADGGASFTVVLTSKPVTDVVIQLQLGGDGDLSVQTLHFTPDNWNTAQLVSVAGHPSDVAGNAQYTVNATLTAVGDTHYDGLTLSTVIVGRPMLVSGSRELGQVFQEEGSGGQPTPAPLPLLFTPTVPGAAGGTGQGNAQTVRNTKGDFTVTVSASAAAGAIKAASFEVSYSTVLGNYDISLARKEVPPRTVLPIDVPTPAELASLSDLLDEPAKTTGSPGERAAAAASQRYIARAMGVLWNELDRLAAPLDTDPWSPAEEITFTSVVTVSVGYVVLNIRSLYLLATVFLSRPLWGQFDVEAVLDDWEENGKTAVGMTEDEDDERDLHPILG